MYRLIYKSRSVSQVDWELIDSIIATSQSGNAELDVSGVLLATRSHFLQVLEGSFERVNDLFYTIVRDPRHTQLQLISFTCTENRVFDNWTMHGIGLFNFNEELSDQMKETYGEEDGEVRLPVQEWQALAMIADLSRAGD